MRVLNVLIKLAQPFGLTPKKLSVESIIKKAKRRTGLTDLGNNRHQPGMDKLLEAVNKAPLTDFGKLSSTGFGVDGISNRLRLVDHLKRHPEVLETKVEKPLFIIGFPRTGTTLIQNLLALSPDRRALPFWELTNPIPVSENPKKDVKKRQRTTKMRLAVANFVVPEMKFIHEVRFDSHEECWPYMINQFTVGNWDMTCRWGDYGKWLLSHDMTETYEEYKKYLQIATQRVPDKKLILKCPDHLWFIDKILEVFPDARIVWTHRDPSRSIPSYCSLASLNWRLLYGEYDPKELGPYIEDRFIEGINRALAVREKVGEDKFLDINFKTLLEDPVKAINQITTYFKLTPVNEQAMGDYLATDRPDNRGKHSYTADYYGLDTDMIKAHYKDYIERFNISTN